MGFVVEDGTGKVDSNSYATAEEADAYFSDRSVSAWTGTSGVKESALIRATDYIEGRFASRFKGQKATSEQALSWPRIVTGYDADEIPTSLKKATYEYALRALTAKLAPDPVVSESGLAVVAEKKKVGPIEKEVQYAQSGPGSTVTYFKPYPAADMLLSSLLISGKKVIRA